MHYMCAPWAPENKQWIFKDPLESKLEDPYHLRITWVDGIRKLFVEEYKQVQATVQQNDILGPELERAFAQQVEPTGL